MKQHIKILTIIAILFSLLFSVNATQIRITKQEIYGIGLKIYKNECGSKLENLTHWNEGEGFASMGIGHCLWYPAGSKQIHDATFPEMLNFLKQNKIKLPKWLNNNYQICPWTNIQSFNKDLNSNKMKSLRKLLKNTIYLQTMFIINRFNSSISKLLQTAKANGTEKHVKTQMYRIAKSHMGMYVLIDYANFKGTGTNKAAEWGLLQVLENMKGTKIGNIACYNFAKSGAYVLKKRVNNSINKKQEKKWYPGWLKRLETYYR